MNSSQFNIHPDGDFIPRIEIVNFLESSGKQWQTLDITMERERILIFTKSNLGIIHLKNQVLWAFEKWEREQKKMREEASDALEKITNPR